MNNSLYINSLTKNLLIIFSVLLIIFFVYSCAQEGSLTGGKKDETPPVLKYSNPGEKTSNFKGEKLILRFDEYFNLKNINTVFLSSPLMDEDPDFKIKGKKLVIELNEKLLDSMTYTLSFGDAIQDYNENNPIKNFKFVFSTGTHVDTMEISGKVSDAYSHKAEEGMYVMLYKNYTDSTPMISKPLYICRTDTGGNFKIDYIKPGSYRIFALTDVNSDYMFNLPNEKIAYTDTFIVPRVKTVIDSNYLKAGTVLKFEGDTARRDTLKTDSLLINKHFIYSPNNLNLFSFIEDKIPNYIKNKDRTFKGKCTFEYNKRPDTFLIKSIDSTLVLKDYLKEQKDTGSIISIWIKDSLMYNQDTLKFQITFFNKDSVGNKIAEIDTFEMVDQDTSKIRHFKIEPKETADIYNPYYFTPETPLSLIDTSKISFFQVIDTVTFDTKEQKVIKALRYETDKLFFVFNRGLASQLRITEKETSDSSSFEIISNKSKDSVFVKIKNDSLINSDTLKVKIDYDNPFFFEQIQKFEKDYEFTVKPQKVTKTNRPEPDLCNIFFQNPLDNQLKIESIYPINERITNFEKTKADEIQIKLYQQKLIETDSLIFKITSEEESDTVKVIYIPLVQKISEFKRYERERFYVKFNHQLYSEPKIESQSFTINNEWVKNSYTQPSDSVNFYISDNFVSNMDSLKLLVRYDFKDKRNKIKKYTDTLLLIKPQNTIRRKFKETPKDVPTGMKTVSVDVPAKFSIEKDSAEIRRYILKFNKKDKERYKLMFDSACFIDIYGNSNMKQEVKFEVLGEKAFGGITLNLSQIKKISDVFFFSQEKPILTDTLTVNPDSLNALTDSLDYSKLDEGELIIILYNGDKNPVRKEVTQTDKKFEFKNLLPGSYTIKLIWDKNKNRKWDTGDYLKNIQPERCINIKKKIEVKAGWTSEEDLKL